MAFTHKLAARLARLKDPVAIAAAVAVATIVVSCEHPVTDLGSIIAQLVVSPQTVTLQQNQAEDFLAVGFTATGDSADIAVSWSATGGTIDSSSAGKRHYGHYTSASCGTFTVTATSVVGNVSGAVSVAVRAGRLPVAAVTVTPQTATIGVGQTAQYLAITRDAFGNPLGGRTVTWSSSNPAVATVNGTGQATGVAVGAATLTATSEGKSGTAAITVTAPPPPAPVASVTVTPAPASVPTGQTVQLTATLKDANGNTLTGRTVSWASSNPAVATVTGSGLVSGGTTGAATITATSETVSGTSALTVTGAASSVVLVGAGDIADCDASPTAALLDNIPGTVFTAGDNAYPDGSSSDYAQCYDPSWGRHKARTRPSPGNHDHNTSGAAGYFGYFGAQAGPAGLGYYSYDLGAWHIVSLDSNIDMSAGSAQETWLRADLAASTKRCAIAYWHHPRFSSGTNHGSEPAAQPLWQALYDFGAEIVISGHDHEYERFAPQKADGTADPARGIREFVVGTGGAGLYSLGTPLPNSEVGNDNSHGVLKLTLSDGSYTWEFIPVAGDSFRDSGSGTCH